jgi:hypothetical protein
VIDYCGHWVIAAQSDLLAQQLFLKRSAFFITAFVVGVNEAGQ